jgi:LPS O-antigen subunit length determinant protein (WzzB/FepE family)
MQPTSHKPLHEYQLIDIFRIWNQFKKTIIIFTLIAMIGSIIVSLIVPEYFESKTIIYPVSMTMSDRNVIFGQQQGQAEFSYFGNKYDASRILQVANSAEVIDYIINKYNLKHHYKYKDDEKYVNTKVKEEFLDNYHALKNDKDAIEITLMDTDKDTCAIMVNDLALKIDEVATRPVTEGKVKIINMLAGELAKKEAVLKTQSGTSSENLKSEIKQLSEALTQYSVSNNDKISSITILEKAMAAEKKKKPVRWLMVALSTIGTLIFCLIASIVISQWRYLKSEL